MFRPAPLPPFRPSSAYRMRDASCKACLLDRRSSDCRSAAAVCTRPSTTQWLHAAHARALMLARALLSAAAHLQHPTPLARRPRELSCLGRCYFMLPPLSWIQGCRHTAPASLDAHTAYIILHSTCAVITSIKTLNSFAMRAIAFLAGYGTHRRLVL